MTEWLIRKFISRPDLTDDTKVRMEYGTLGSMTGIICNILLFIIKLTIALLAGSVSILSDAFNNLSDCLSCLIALFGYKVSARPADREHPFGHGRMEYIAGFLIAMIIFGAAFELLRSSLERILHPAEMTFSIPLMLALVFTIAVKLWMSVFYQKTGSRIHSVTLLASSKDSRNDTLSTGLTLAALILSTTGISFPFDGAAGLVISLLIFKSGYEIAKDIIDRLLGKPADAKLSESIRIQILSHPEILGIHDLIIHDYGPGVRIGSAHAEVDSRMTLIKAHDVIDRAEKEILQNYHVSMTIHTDPVDLQNESREVIQKKLEQAFVRMDPDLSIHDLRLKEEGENRFAEFDVVIPYGCKWKGDDIQAQANAAMKSSGYQAVITFDHEYTERNEDE